MNDRLARVALSLAAAPLMACSDGGGHARDDSHDAGSDGASSSAAFDASPAPSLPLPDGAGGAAPDGPRDRRNTIPFKDGAAPDGSMKGLRPDAGGGIVDPNLTICGNGTRALDEECDDGNATETDFCTSTCTTREVVVAPQTAVSPPAILPSRWLGEGRHPVAAGSEGFAIAYVEPESDPPKVKLARFDAVGVAKPILDVGMGTTPIGFSDPVVTAVADGSYVVAYTAFGGDGDGLGIALRQVTNAGLVSPVEFANASTLFGQYDPDVLWTGAELVVAWADDADGATGPDIRYRRFDATLTPLDAVDQTLAATAAVEGRVSLAEFAGTWVASWRAGSAADGQERVVIRWNGVEWRTPLAFSPTPDNLPALVELDATHLLAAFTVAMDPIGVGVPRFPSVHLSVLDTAAPGDVSSVPFQDATGPQEYDDQVSLVRVGTRVLLALRLYVEGYNDEILLKELHWNGTMLDRAVPHRWLLEDFPFYLGDQRHPAVAASSLGPEGALVVAWDSHAAPEGVVQSEPDVLAKLLPLPFVEGGGG